MVTLLLKSSFIIIVLLAFYKIFLEKESFFSINRTYLLACLGIAFLLPFIALPRLIEHQGYMSTLLDTTTPQEMAMTITKEKMVEINQLESDEVLTEKTISAPINEESTFETSTKKNVEITKNTRPNEVANLTNTSLKMPAYSYADWALLIYLFGVVVLSLNLIAQIGSMLFRVIRNPDKIYDTDGIIVNMNGIIEPCSFFNYIFINPTSYDYDTYEQIIAHEKIHVQKAHTFDLLIAEIAVIALWFNPFIWLFRKEVEKNIEYQTDALLVKNEPQQKEDYQMNLLKIATYNKPLTIVTNYNQSLIKQRILKMNSKQSTPYSYWKYAFIAPLLFVLLLVLNEPVSVMAQTSNHDGIALSETEKQKVTFDGEKELSPASFEEQATTPSSIVTSKSKLVATSNEVKNQPIPKEKEANKIVETYTDLAACEALERAAKANDEEAVRQLLLNYDH